jgi:putative chitinase
VTPGIDQLTAAGVSKELAEQWLIHVQKALARYSINTPRQVAAWIAQTAHESGGFRTLTENLNYSADTMAVVWPARFAEQEPDPKRPGKTKPKKDAKGKSIPNKFALALHRKPELLANVVYANRMANGPTESGDGWRYRGRGLKQLTGKDNYSRCGAGLGMNLVENPDLLLQPEGASLSAAWFWSINKCGPIADSGDFVALTKKINGGTIGLEDRQRRYKAVLASLGQ